MPDVVKSTNLKSNKFPSVVRFLERRYVLRYWRYLLKWRAEPPAGFSIPLDVQLHLRELARIDIALDAAKPKEGVLIQWPVQQKK